MNSSKNLGSAILKAILFATLLFWTLFISENTNSNMSYFVLLSIIPIAIICSITIFITITPFFWLAKENVTDKEIFKKYFPYYSIIAFGISSYFIISTNFEGFVCAFFITAFFTLMQSWVWICKIPTNK